MKIAYVLSAFPKLSESFILNEIVELLKRGHDVQIFSISHPCGIITHKEIEEYNLLRRAHYFAPELVFNINLLRFSKYFAKAFIQNLSTGNISKNELKLDAKLAYFATIMKGKDMELIHVHFANMGSVARRLGKMLGLPYTLTAHAFDIYISPDTETLKQTIDDASGIFTPSEYNKKYLMDITKCEENKIQIVRATINPKKFVRAKKYKSKQIIMAGRLIEKKGMKYMIKAMKDITVQHPEAVLNIIGDGPLEKELKNLIRKYELGENVKLKGSIADAEYHKELEASAVAVLPCIIAENGDRDVCPLTLQEAMSMEVPVVSTNVHSIPELIDNGVSGVLAPPKNEKALAEEIIKLLNEPELKQQMGKNGREKILGEFNIQLQVSHLVRIWEGMINDFESL